MLILPNMAPSKLEIKVKALQRLLREKEYYEKELKEQEQELENMKQSSRDEYEIKKQDELVAEAKRMLPELDSKIKQHKAELAKFVEEYKGEESTEEARRLLQ
ncbi:hypothetical protein PUMCH_002796 [Australozyma saopauloensis]|uniref:Tubulin-specific chaperone A n=1 Tax=Australozyma saopauloensis TaxID=291208 RepID=A0AAX4HAW0_9ASCO|nr:hypothetical protein PUMCH_002796 [[Candida] saopauloensis]